jgi:ATP-binding cassette, subfamily F, member 3
MIEFHNVTLRRGTAELLRGASFTVFPGWRVGVTGRNGTGKSSLFALLRGELTPDAGAVHVPERLRLASLAQESPTGGQRAGDYVLDGDDLLRAAQLALARVEAGGDGAAIARAHADLEHRGAYTAPARVARLLRGLGFAPGDEDRPVDSFSGGWRMRLALARTLMTPADVLLLDEPTNHLDLDAVLWLQGWLREFPGTVLVISHDRELLDTVTTHTLHLAGQRATLESGNYSAFEALRAQRLAQQGAAHARQTREIAHLQSFVDRFRAKATKARQAQSRLKRLDRMVRVPPVTDEHSFDFSFRTPLKLPTPLLRLDDVAIGYDGRALLRGVRLDLTPGARVGLLGPNGAGKTTLVRALAGELPILAGQAQRAPDLCVGYFAQHQVEQLDLSASALTHLRRLDAATPEQALRDHLGAFGFRGGRVHEPIAPFSGGEKARLALALLVWLRPNLLLLDEPTNHLDLDLRRALAEALQDFPGALVLVAHDRHLLETTCDAFWRVADGAATPFDGDLDDYARWLAARRSEQSAPAIAAPLAQARARQRLARDEEKALRAAFRRAETELERAQAALAALDARLADPELYVLDGEAITALAREREVAKARLDGAEAAWLMVAEAIETPVGIGI